MISQKDLDDTNTYQELKILFEDAHLLVCYKPAGVPWDHPPPGSAGGGTAGICQNRCRSEELEQPDPGRTDEEDLSGCSKDSG